jgi:hypothetical protein
MFFYNILTYSDSDNERTKDTMTVNPNLAALMRVIEDNQDKMPEGEYLEAMNALGALHRQIPAPAPVPVAAAALPAGGGPPPSYNASVPLFQQRQFLYGDDREVEYAAWFRVSSEHPEHFGISVEAWMEFSQEQRNRALREATEMVVNNLERRSQNSEPEECPFIARHAVGPWRMEGVWECACGYKGYCRHWQKHEQGERHQDWAKHRTVSRRKIEMMKKAIRRDERGDMWRFKPRSQTEFGGIRFFVTRQERNEWTHPEMYAPIHRSPIPTANGPAKWFVHHRDLLARVYVE